MWGALRSNAVLEARRRRQRGEISAEELREVEDVEITRVVARQEAIGLEAITDGEFRRALFHVDFLENLKGVLIKSGIPIKFRSSDGEQEFAPPVMEVAGRLERTRPIAVNDFAFLKSKQKETAKLCIPSPTKLHFRGGRKGTSQEVYPDIEEFF